jgi:hypothetical protein
VAATINRYYFADRGRANDTTILLTVVYMCLFQDGHCEQCNSQAEHDPDGIPSY